MKILNAIADANIVKTFYEKTKTKLDAMISYKYLQGQAYKLTTEYRSMIGLLFLDSGAFSSSTGRASISVTEYARYINLYGDRFDEVFNLDDQFDSPEHNMENLIYLRKNLPPNRKQPLPVVHSPDDPLEEIESFVKLGYDYVAIGSNKKLKDEIFEKIKEKYPNLRLHMFGSFNRKMLARHRPFSADSSTYAKMAGMGFVLYWRSGEEKEYEIYTGDRDKTLSKRQIHFKDFRPRNELPDFLKTTFDYTYRDLLTSYVAKQVVNFYFMKQLEDHINNNEAGNEK